MDNIVLDTNIFLKENFLEGRRINQLLKFSEKDKIEITLTRITVEEVKNNFEKQSKKALEYLGRFRNEYESRSIRNLDIGKKYFEKPKFEEIIQTFNDKFEKRLNKSNVNIIEYSASQVDIGIVFDKYFNKEKPFDGKSKKSEFPDMFSLILTEKWCNENDIKAIVFSKDNDFLNYNTDVFIVDNNYEEYLDRLLKSELQKRTEILNTIFQKNSAEIDNSLIDFFKEKLDDITLLYEHTYYEIHQLIEIKVDIESTEYKIVSINDDGEIEIEVSAILNYKIELEIDDENSSYYDSDEKAVFYRDTVTEVFEGSITAKAIFLAHIYTDEDFSEYLDFEKIDDYKIHIDRDRYL